MRTSFGDTLWMMMKTTRMSFNMEEMCSGMAHMSSNSRYPMTRYHSCQINKVGIRLRFSKQIRFSYYVL